MRRHGFDDYRELVARSQEDPEWFWAVAIEDMGLDFATPWSQVVDLSRGPEWATWFVGSTLSIAWNCVHRWADRDPDRIATVGRGEDGSRWEYTFAELSDQVTRLARRPRRARRRAGRPRGDLHADVPGGRDRVPRLRSHRRRAGADLLRLRRARRAGAPPGLRGGGRRHERLVAPARQTPRHARDGRRGGSRVPGRGARRDVEPRRRFVGRHRARPGRAAAARGRLGAPLPPHLHLGDDREAEGRRPRPGRLPRLHRPRARLPGRRAHRRRHPLRHGHGLDHGPMDRRRGRRDGRQDRLRRGRARLPRRPPLEDDRRGARQHPRLLAHPHPGADAARRPAGGPLLAPSDRDDGGALEPGSVPLALRQRRRRARPGDQLLGRDGDRRVLPLAHTGESDQALLGRRPRAGDGRRRRRPGRKLARRHGRGRGTRLPEALPRDDARVLARPGALPRRVLAPVSGYLGAR